MIKVNVPRLFLLLVGGSLLASVLLASPVYATHTNTPSPATSVTKQVSPAQKATQPSFFAVGGKWLLQITDSVFNGVSSFFNNLTTSVGNIAKSLASKPSSVKSPLIAQKPVTSPTATPASIAQVPVERPTKTTDAVLDVAEDLDLNALGERIVALETNFTSFTAPSLFILDSTSENILRNSSFEAESGGKPRQWNYQLDSTTGNTFRSAEGIRSGSYGLKFKGEGSGNFGISQPDVKTTAGRTYTYSTYIKVVNAPKITVRVGFWDEHNNRRGTMKDFTFSGTKDWSRISMKATTTGLITDSKNWFPMIEILGLSSGSIYLDDSKLEEGSILTAYNTASAKTGSNVGDGSVLYSTGGDLYPAQSGVGRLGTSDNKWEDLFLSDDADIGDALTVGDNLTVGGDVTVNGDDLTSDGNLTIAATGYVRIGDSGTPGVATADDELYVLGDIETDANVDIAGNLTVAGTQTFSGDQTITGDLAVNGGDITSTATTFNLLNGTVTTLNIGGALTALNLADSTTVKTIDIGGVTSDGTDTINISTSGGTNADTISIGNSNASTAVAITGGDDWSMTGTGILTMSASAAQTTAILATDTDYTNALSVGDNNIIGTTGAIDYTNFDVSTGGNITVAAGVGIDTNAAGILTIGNTTATTINIGNAAATTVAVGAGGALARTFNVGTGTGVDTINIGTGGTGVDVIRIGDSAADLALTDANWSITTAGLITTADDVAINGGDLTTTAATFNLLNAATTLNIGSTNIARTINVGTGTDVDTINIGSGATGADVITIGGGVGTLAINTGDWDISTTGAVTGIGAITSDGTITSGGTFTGSGATTYDAGGAAAIAIGSADVTALTVTTDGTGTAEVVLPDGSIGSAEILDATIATADLANAAVTLAKTTFLTGSATWDPASLVDAAGETSAAITVTGAAFGDGCVVGNPYDLVGSTATCYVSAADAAKIRLQNESGATFDGASGTWKVYIIK